MIRRSSAALVLTCTFALGAGSSADEDKPCIEGRISLKAQDKGKLRTGYVGYNTRGMLQSNFAGFTLQPGEVGWSVQAITFKPRVSWLSSDKKDDIRFRHVKVEPGHYLVYACWGDRFLEWRWLEVKADSQVSMDFALDPATAGRVEVKPAKPAERIHLIPLDADGKVPLPVKMQSSVAQAIGTSIKAAGPTPVIDGLRPGRYRVLAGPATAVVEIKAGETVSVFPK